MLRAEWVAYLSTALSGFAVFLMVWSLLSRRRDQEILLWASGDEPAPSRSPLIRMMRPLMHQLVLKYVPYFKKDSERVEKVEKLILTAGLRDELNVDEFIGFQIFFGIAFPLFLGILNYAYDLGLPPALVLILGALGWKFPELYANSEKKKRQTSIRAELPFIADLLALSTEAGLDFVGAIQKIVDKDSGTVLGQELAIVLKDIRLGATRAAALKALALRCDLMEITSFVSVIVDADQTGASISRVLKDQSQQIRLERFVRAEKAGARASQAIMFPILIFIVPAFFLVIFGPIAIGFLSGGGK